MKHARDKVGILVVDDRRDRLLAVETMLSELGERVVLAQSGRDALRFLLQEDFAVILLDVDMPIMDGFETARLIRQRKRSRQTPIIFLTAFGDAIQAEQGYALGAVDYMLVPVDPDILRAKVSVFVELYRKTEEANLAAQAIARKAGQLAALARASLSINAARSVEAMLDAIASGTCAALGARSSFVALVSGSKHGTAACSAGGLAAPRTVPADPASDWILTRVATAGSVVTLSASERAQREPVNADEPGPLMAVPLVGADGTCVGWIEVTNGEADGFSEDDESLLLLSAQLASVALQNLLHAEEREVSRLKDEFLATLSHELRTPLTAIIGWTRILRETQPDAAKLARGLEVIDRNAGAQNKLIEDLLDVSRIVTGKMSMEQRQVRLGSLVEASVDALRPAAQAKDITLVVVCSAGRDSVEGDPERLRQVATNLLSNAIKFTPRGGRIEVRLRRVGDELELAVADNGEGIRPDFLPYVFDRFRQGDSSSRRMHGGLGIGLAVVRHIVVSHGGTVAAHSEGPRQGSTFTVRLPSAFLPREGDGPTPPPYGKARLPLPDLSGLRVLVVDDDQDTREILRQVLAAHRADVRIAATVREAIAELDAARPHVLVSDIAMPGEDGYDFIDFVRRRAPERGGAVPALALTAHARAEDQARALAAGFQRHAAKPIDPAELVRAIAGLVGAPCSRVEPAEAVALREVP
ncbi:hybrid sensor histidine kinase/response regulator [Polyangium jinanense]|uniref:histidine kinase n=1 Tax=Polyangium jinanense TaxID=2829994 RepID=A0A9X3XD39_9BACT|nr:response regulator [Polyangium jinanense]MDC3962500.1 response regulator [Polyangium jinanense]MDC3988449.1 response regulator [Polyangium jinanense]